jgi:hypothetical protein
MKWFYWKVIRQMRRDKNDLEWQEVKRIVTKRDNKSCRLLKILSAREGFLLQKKAPAGLLNRLDHAHCFPASVYTKLIYLEKNIVLLNRYSHHMLDDCCNPITGELITYEERQKWWERIVGTDIYQYLLNEVSKET